MEWQECEECIERKGKEGDECMQRECEECTERKDEEGGECFRRDGKEREEYLEITCTEGDEFMEKQ